MIRTKASTAVFLSIFLFVAQLVSAANTSSISADLSFKRKVWKVLYLPLSLHQVSENTKLAGLIPNTLYSKTKKSQDHHFSPGEIEDFQAAVLNEKLSEEYDKLTDLYNTRDDFILSYEPIDAGVRYKNRIDIRDMNKSISELKKFDSSTIAIPKKLPIEVKLIAAKSYDSHLALLLEEDADVIIYGSLREQGGVARLELVAYNHWSRSSQVLWDGAVSTVSLDEKIPEILRQVNSLLLGRPWANLEVRAQPADKASIYLDGKLIAIGRAELLGLEIDKSYQLEIRGQGYTSIRNFIRLEAFEERRLNYELAEKEAKFISINTRPEAAELYIGSRYIGESPLRIEVPDYTQLISIRAPGYIAKNIKLAANEEEDLVFALEIDFGISAQRNFEKSRTRFYWFAGFFTGSLAVPILAAGLSTNFSQLYAFNSAASYTEEAQKNRLARDVSNVVLFSGIGLSAVFLGFSIWAFIEYTKAAEQNTLVDAGSKEPDKDLLQGALIMLPKTQIGASAEG